MRMSTAGSRSRGFTLIELLVVLTIMITATLAIAVAAPGFRHGTDLEAAASELASALKKARMLAVSTQKIVVFSVDTNSRRYAISGSRKPRTLPSSVVIRSSTGAQRLDVRFYPDGGADNAGLSLAGGERRLALTVSPLTGRVSVLR